jgi:hypothetical protein
MPALLMHIEGADRVRRDSMLPAAFDRAAAGATWAYHLGAALVDLPLFEGFWLKVALFFAHRPYPESRWAAALHAHGSASLAAALLRRAGEAGEERREVLLALVAGLLTHIAFDRSMHPPIEAAVNAHLCPDETSAQLHEALENYQSLRWHREHLGCDGLGTALLRDGVRVGPGPGARMPEWLRDAFAASLAETYGVGPSPRELSRWISGICGYRDLLGSPAALLSTRSSDRLAERRPWVADVELEPALERAVALSAAYLEAAHRAAEAQGAGLVDAIGDGPLV